MLKRTNQKICPTPEVGQRLGEEKEASTGDLEERKEKYFDFQKVLLDDSPATFLYFPKSSILYREKAKENLGRVLPLQFPAGSF